MGHDRKLYVFLMLVAAETVFLIAFSFLPSVPTVRTGFFRIGDIEHFIAYLIYGLLLSRALSYSGRGRRMVLIVPVIAGVVLGVSCEAIQFFVPLRTADLIDVAVDVAGSLAGSVISFPFLPERD